MLYHFFEYIEKTHNLAGAGLFEYLSFRSAIAAVLSLVISMIFGGRIIRSLKKMQVGETIRDLGLEGQLEKAGTPTMGGVIIFLAIMVPCLLLADLTNIYIQIMLLATVWLTLIGGVDDYIKVFRKNKKGLHGKFKIIGQVVLGLVIALGMLHHDDILVRSTAQQAQDNGWEVVEVLTPQADPSETQVFVKTSLTNVPFFKANELEYRDLVRFLGDNVESLVLNILFALLVIFIITAVSNAANMTDGIDGLAAGVSAIIAVVIAIFAYVSGNTVFADYLGILYIPYSGELVIYSFSFLGACIGFLWYNSYPAKVFMGDTGSLMLGGSIAVMAILLRKELLLPVMCGIFLVETASVIIQVSYFKHTKKKYGEGRRVFLMSPLHHHYQKMGMHEAKIVSRFWIIQVLLAILTVVTLKIR